MGEVLPSPPQPGDETNQPVKRTPTREMPAVVTKGDWAKWKRWVKIVGVCIPVVAGGSGYGHYAAKQSNAERIAVLEYRIGELERQVDQLDQDRQKDTAAILAAIKEQKK